MSALLSSAGMPSAIMSRDIDLVHLARQTAGDRGLEREVLALFRDQCERMVAAIAQARVEPPARMAAHTLKGAARGVGAYRVADAAARCETAAEAEADAALAELEAAARDARALIDRLLDVA